MSSLQRQAKQVGRTLGALALGKSIEQSIALSSSMVACARWRRGQAEVAQRAGGGDAEGKGGAECRPRWGRGQRGGAEGGLPDRGGAEGSERWHSGRRWRSVERFIIL